MHARMMVLEMIRSWLCSMATAKRAVAEVTISTQTQNTFGKEPMDKKFLTLMEMVLKIM